MIKLNVGIIVPNSLEAYEELGNRPELRGNPQLASARDEETCRSCLASPARSFKPKAAPLLYARSGVAMVRTDTSESRTSDLRDRLALEAQISKRGRKLMPQFPEATPSNVVFLAFAAV